MLSADGKVAEQGSYAELSARKDGAFTKLMEWQMSGGDVVPDATRPRQHVEHSEGEGNERFVGDGEEGEGDGEGTGEGEGEADDERRKVGGEVTAPGVSKS